MTPAHRHFLTQYLISLLLPLAYLAWVASIIPTPLWMLVFIIATLLITDRVQQRALYNAATRVANKIPRDIIAPEAPIPTACILLHDELLALSFERAGDVIHHAPFAKKPHTTYWYHSADKAIFATLVPTGNYDTFGTVTFRTLFEDGNKIIETAYPAGFSLLTQDIRATRNSYSLDTTYNEHMYSVTKWQQQISDADSHSSLSTFVDHYYSIFAQQITKSYLSRRQRVFIWRKMFVVGGWTAVSTALLGYETADSVRTGSMFITSIFVLIIAMQLWHATDISDLDIKSAAEKPKQK